MRFFSNSTSSRSISASISVLFRFAVFITESLIDCSSIVYYTAKMASSFGTRKSFRNYYLI
nr:MAG TPA: hypothetical protein [Caudoviricetes sp.]